LNSVPPTTTWVSSNATTNGTTTGGHRWAINCHLPDVRDDEVAVQVAAMFA